MKKINLFSTFLLNVLVCTLNCFDLVDYDRFIRQISTNQTFIADFEQNLNYLQEIEPNYFDWSPLDDEKYQFDCDTTGLPTEPATSVHALKPSDISVVAALGDSLTAALGSNAKTIFGLLIEYRGRSWSIGGSKNIKRLVTLPNILKIYNPDLKGYARRSNLAYFNEDGVGLNVAVSGQESNHIPNQMKLLITRMRNNKDIDFQNDWKLVTLFIGGNDLCRFCNDLEKHSPEAYIKHIRDGLDLLYKEVPRVFVNLVQVLNITHVRDLNKGLICNELHKLECKCSAFPTGNQTQQLEEYLDQYQNYTQQLVDSGRYDGRDDFAVVVQPFFEEFTTPILPNGKIDFSYLAPDCFHFSTKGHAAAAMGLWNNMLQPVGQKSTAWTPQDRFLCPSPERPYFYTKKNSN